MDKQKIDVLNKMIQEHLPARPDGTNVLNSPKGIIDDEQLEKSAIDLADKDADA